MALSVLRPALLLGSADLRPCPAPLPRRAVLLGEYRGGLRALQPPQSKPHPCGGRNEAAAPPLYPHPPRAGHGRPALSAIGRASQLARFSLLGQRAGKLNRALARVAVSDMKGSRTGSQSVASSGKSLGDIQGDCDVLT